MAEDPDDPGDDGDDDVPPRSDRTSTAGDVDEVMRLLTWARQKGYALPQLRVGSVTLVAQDLRPRFGGNASPGVQHRTIWQEHGLDDEGKE